MLYELIYFFYPENRWWGASVPAISYSFLSVMLMAFVLMKGFKDFNENKILKVPHFRYLFLVFLTLIISSLFSPIPSVHSLALNYFFKLIIIILIAYKLCKSARDLNFYIMGYVLGSWYFSYLVYQTGRNYQDRVEYIGFVDAPESNGFAAAIAPSLVLALHYFWVAKNHWHRLLFALIGAFLANALVLINSRGAFLAVVAGGGFYMYQLYFSKARVKYQRLGVIMVTIFGLAGAIYIADDGFIARMYTITEEAESLEETKTEGQTGATRVIFWAAAWELTKDYPLGVGARGFEFYAPQYIPQEVATGKTRNRAVHSTWFEALSETGYLGFLFFVLMLIASFRALSKVKKNMSIDTMYAEHWKMTAIQGSLITFAVSMTFLNRMRAEVLYWLILYSACAYNLYVLKADKNIVKK
jgi:O-antigen ligase